MSKFQIPTRRNRVGNPLQPSLAVSSEPSLYTHPFFACRRTRWCGKETENFVTVAAAFNTRQKQQYCCRQVLLRLQADNCVVSTSADCRPINPFSTQASGGKNYQQKIIAACWVSADWPKSNSLAVSTPTPCLFQLWRPCRIWRHFVLKRDWKLSKAFGDTLS